jgi:hypothetical protein
MPATGTSGSMSGDGKRSVAAWPKLLRPSSTLLNVTGVSFLVNLTASKRFELLHDRNPFPPLAVPISPTV